MTRFFRVYGILGHRQRESFSKSYSFTDCKGVSYVVFNSDITGTNDYTELVVSGGSNEIIDDSLRGQLSDGIFENSNFGDVCEYTTEEYLDSWNEKELDSYDPSYIYSSSQKDALIDVMGDTVLRDCDEEQEIDCSENMVFVEKSTSEFLVWNGWMDVYEIELVGFLADYFGIKKI